MHNLTQGSPTRLILKFASPILLGAFFQQAYLLVDAAVVGNFMGAQSLAAVGSTGAMVFLLMGLSFGSSQGLAIPISRAFGAGDHAAVRRFFAAGLLISAGVAVVIALIGGGFARQILSLSGTPAEIVDEAVAFMTVLLGGSVVSVAMNYLVAAIRALGDSKTPLYFLVGSSLLNGVLVFAFVGGLQWGVRGAAIATLVSHLAAAVGMLLVINWRIPELRPSRAEWSHCLQGIREPLRNGLPMAVQMAMLGVGGLAIQIAVNRLGTDAVAAHTASGRLVHVAFMPMLTFGMATVTFVAQNRGAGQWRRIRQGVFRAGVIGVIMAVVFGGAIAAFGNHVVGLLVGFDQVEVLELTRVFFLIDGPLFWIIAIGIVLRNALQGMGTPAIPLLSSVLETGGRVLAAIFLIAPLGFVGVALAQPLAWIIGIVPMSIAWARHRRRLKAQELDEELATAIAPAAPLAADRDALGDAAVSTPEADRDFDIAV
ncbi:MAG: MATE family efflux transporter [Promicromonosporaceae bacterium]|nr:MATE family efflux transporter [Promicromonosporaceae bacterium]